MLRTYKYKLNLKKGIITVDKTLKNCCWLYNYLLKQFRERDKSNQKQLTQFELINSLIQIKKDYEFLKEIQADVLQDIAKRVHKT